ncbi:hypothetical protein ACTVMJ_25280, partial [Serratia marcescens]
PGAAGGIDGAGCGAGWGLRHCGGIKACLGADLLVFVGIGRVSNLTAGFVPGADIDCELKAVAMCFH